MKTLLLALNTWDLTLTANGDIAVADEPYAPAQDAASACRVFSGEEWYDTLAGIPYLQQIFGRPPVPSFIKSQLEGASLTVPGITAATCFLTGFVNRSLAAQVQLTFSDGSTAVIGTGEVQGAAPWYVNAASPAAAGSLEGGP